MSEALNRAEDALYEGHMQLKRNHLVRWTMGNISTRFSAFGEDVVLIKPSGVPYDRLGRDAFSFVHLSGAPFAGKLNNPTPSTDTLSHCALYRMWDAHRWYSKADPKPVINAICHTHSTYATAFAVAGMPIPCIATSIADEFGGVVPCAGYATIGGEQIAEVIMTELRVRYVRAVLLRSHGVFTFGATVDDAVKAAVMVEDAAKTVYIAAQLQGHSHHMRSIPDLPLPEIRAAHYRYTHNYGQGRK